jgi:probable blue pigment (indigoidine) exporter
VSRYHTLVGFFLLACLWGLSFVAVRAGVVHIPPVVFAALRFDLAGVGMLVYAVISTDHWRPRVRNEWTVVVLGGACFVALHHALLFIGQQYVTSAVASVVISLDPVLAALFAWILLPDERLSPIQFAGIGLGLVGVGIVAHPNPRDLLGADIIGILFVSGAAAAFALGAVLTRRYRTTLPVQSLQAWMMLIGAVLLHITSVVLPGTALTAIDWTPTALFALSYLAFGAGGVGYLLYFALLDRLGPVEINLVGYVAPLFAAIGGWLFLGEQPDLMTGLGFVVVLSGFVLLKHEAYR